MKAQIIALIAVAALGCASLPTIVDGARVILNVLDASPAVHDARACAKAGDPESVGECWLRKREGLEIAPASFTSLGEQVLSAVAQEVAANESTNAETARCQHDAELARDAYEALP